MRTGMLSVATSWCVVFVALSAACGEADSKPLRSEEREERLHQLRETIDTLSVVIHPVVLAGRPMQNVAEVLALMFEQGGLTDIDVASVSFVPEKGTELEDLAVRYGSFVAGQEVEADYALFGEFIGTPGNGVEGVRAVVVDNDGRIVWTDSQTAADEDFRRLKPNCPMTCCLLLAERLRTALKLPEPDPENMPRGRWAAHWDKASGLPPEEQRAAMKDRQRGLREKLGSSQVTVLPVLLVEGTDRDAAVRLAERMERDGICRKATVGGERTFSLQPTPNEMKHLWDVARSLQESLKANPTSGPYTLCVEYLMSPRTGRAHGVHWVLCDAAGNWVVVDLQNSHHHDFQHVDPASVDDCNDLVLRRVRSYLENGSGTSR